MKKIKTIFKKATPALAVFAVVILVTVITRAISIMKEEKQDNDIVVDGVSFWRFLWLELKSVLKFSRY